jgi:hypothetical protein
VGLWEHVIWMVGTKVVLWTYCIHLPMVCKDTPRILLQNVHNHAPDQWRTQEFFGGGGCSTNSVEEGRQEERGLEGGSPLVRGSTQFAKPIF